MVKYKTPSSRRELNTLLKSMYIKKISKKNTIEFIIKDYRKKFLKVKFKEIYFIRRRLRSKSI